MSLRLMLGEPIRRVLILSPKASPRRLSPPSTTRVVSTRTTSISYLTASSPCKYQNEYDEKAKGLGDYLRELVEKKGKEAVVGDKRRHTLVSPKESLMDNHASDHLARTSTETRNFNFRSNNWSLSPDLSCLIAFEFPG